MLLRGPTESSISNLTKLSGTPAKLLCVRCNCLSNLEFKQ